MPDTKIQLVFWRDHEGKAGWSETDDFHKWSKAKASTCCSVGFLAAETPDHVVLANAMHHGGLGDGQKILKTDIVERRTIKRYRRPLLTLCPREG